MDSVRDSLRNSVMPGRMNETLKRVAKDLVNNGLNNKINIKTLRTDLKHWGKFWRNKETVNGFASCSLRERYDGGSTDINRSENIQVPVHVEELTQFISLLRPECIRALRARYIIDKPLDNAAILMGFDSKRSVQFWLGKAERSLLLCV